MNNTRAEGRALLPLWFPVGAGEAFRRQRHITLN
jgi:hypothetical protein